MKKGFTLAEILIALGVIGIVAAMTLPTVIKNYQKHSTINKLKTTYSILNNALEMSKTEYGTDINAWDMPNVNKKTDSEYFAKTYLIPNLKIIKEEKTSDNRYSFILANGVYVVVWAERQGATVARSRILLDMYINGKKSKYKYRREYFRVELGGGSGESGLDRNKFFPYGFLPSYQRNVVKNQCINEYKYCFELIFIDNWQIKDDYPW